MRDCFYKVDFENHALEFNGTSLESAQYEPDHDCFSDVEYSDDHFVSGETDERVEITVNYRGLKGTPSYQVDVLLNGRCVQILMVQTTPNGETYELKSDEYSY